jgi:hypothetical protein
MTHRVTIPLLLASLCLWLDAQANNHSVVLVTNERCHVSELSNLDIRKAYLGVTVSVGDQVIRPLRVVGDPELDRIFFQTIVAMSEKSYERRALSLALKFGTPRPAEHESVDEALAALQRTSCGVVFLWAEDMHASNNTKTIRVLWQGN